MLASEFFKKYEGYCPKELAMADDPVGLQLGTLDKEIKTVMVALDIREQTVQEAIDKQVDVILAKHPVIFRPLDNLTDQDTQQKIILDLARAGIAIYTSHTNIDIVSGGLNDYFCEMLEMTEIEELTNFGLGRVGNIQPQTLAVFADNLKARFELTGLSIVSYDQSLSKVIKRVAICGGSGGKFYPDALAKEADVYVTGDIYYHTAHDMLSSGLTAIDPGHHIEVLFIKKVAQVLRAFNTDVTIIESDALTNPFIHQ
ncbi:Nif3-like dinuclear metal center hexameric protein [Lactococcus carnosus]|uniref:GTP cyclohydrolase 1 type 2 homolog n=1 Tax=Pseudolactococcus carnosus TaxID=2749961 RepID=A0ABT0AR70_9LACT|nr:Nif3-like dinuclear metal center hexameric protein [Lactococcus carnosus]MCJ1989191.1 Nif3-like dinuclear metal center hexameric protein [Lactococcus carnosus]